MQNQFPRLVYKSASDHQVAHDEEQFRALILAGWFPSVPEALAPRDMPSTPQAPLVETKTYGDGTVATGTTPLPDQSPDEQEAAEAEAPPTRAELEAKAVELGLEFSPNIGDKKLAARIADALAAK